MKTVRKLVVLALTLTLVLSLCAVNSLAASKEKLICFTNCSMGFKDYPETEKTPAYRLYQAIVDGELTEVKVLRSNSWIAASPLDSGYNIWGGPALCTFNDEGYVTSNRPVDKMITGYATNPPDTKNRTITLGVKETTFKYASDVKVYIYSNDLPIADYCIDISNVSLDQYSEYNLLLNDAGEIQTMYTSKGYAQGAYPLFDTVQKFDSSVGPVDPATGYSTEYLYYKPEVKTDTKYPLFIWLHGAYCGQNTWSSPFNFNDFAKYATPEYQSQFTAGGAYVMAPNAHEVKGENGRVWTREQVQPVFNAIDDFIAKNPNVDTTRIYVGGFSMGGGMTWALVNARPTFFAAAIPCCAATWIMPSSNMLDKVASLPMWVIHSNYDPVVSIANNLSFKPIMEANAELTGTDTRFTILGHVVMPDGVTPVPNDHLCWVSALNNMTFNDGSKYVDINGIPVKSTLVDWLNSQSTTANAARAREAVFTDVNAGDWYYKYVMDLTQDKDIISSQGGNSFEPNTYATLGQILKAVMLAADYSEQAPTGIDWASGYLSKAIADGLVDETANSAALVSRLDTVKVIVKAFNLKSTLSESPFSDTKDPDVLALYQSGYITGHNSTFNPYGIITRAELCAILWRILYK